MAHLFGTGTEFQLTVPPFTVLNIFGSSLNPQGYNIGTRHVATPSLDGTVQDMDTMSPQHPNHEAFCCTTRLTKAFMNSRIKPVTFTLKHEWKRGGPPGTIWFTAQGSFTIPLNNLTTGDLLLFTFVGWANNEIESNESYAVTATTTDTRGLFDVDTDRWDVINAEFGPHQETAGSEGHIWIEGNNLCFIDALRIKHTILPSFADIITSTPGYLFVDDSISPLGRGNGVRLAWTSAGNRVNRSIQTQGGNWAPVLDQGAIWTGALIPPRLQQIGTLAFTSRALLPDFFGDFQVGGGRMDDGNGGT